MKWWWGMITLPLVASGIGLQARLPRNGLSLFSNECLVRLDPCLIAVHATRGYSKQTQQPRAITRLLVVGYLRGVSTPMYTRSFPWVSTISLDDGMNFKFIMKCSFGCLHPIAFGGEIHGILWHTRRKDVYLSRCRMLTHQSEVSNHNARVPVATVFYLGAEVLLAALFGLSLAVLAIIKSTLPKPPRDLTNDKVVVTGAGSDLGRAVAQAFSRAGCTVASIDQDLNLNQKNSPGLASQHRNVEDLERHNDFCQVPTERQIIAYKCDSAIESNIFDTAKKIHKDVGHIDVLITCPADSSKNTMTSLSTHLMSHYWTILAFIPFMIQCNHSQIVAVIPTTSTEDAHMGSKAVISGIIEAIRQHVSNPNQLTFTTMASKAEARLTNQSEQQTAQDIVEAVRRDQHTLIRSWGSYALYPVCRMAYEAIKTFTQWLYRQGCED